MYIGKCRVEVTYHEEALRQEAEGTVGARPVVAAAVVGVMTLMMMLRWLLRSPRMRIPRWVM